MVASSFSVFYLVGGSSNFVCRALTNRAMSQEQAEKEVKEVKAMGYPTMMVATKKAAVLGGFCSFNEFETEQERKNYFQEVKQNYLS